MRSKVVGSGFVRLDNHLTLKTGLVPFSLSSSCDTKEKLRGKKWPRKIQRTRRAQQDGTTCSLPVERRK